MIRKGRPRWPPFFVFHHSGLIHPPLEGEGKKENYSAAILTSGAAALISGVTCCSNLVKFFWNRPTNSRAVLSNAALSFQVLNGFKRCGSIPGTEVGTEKPKYGSVRKSASLSEPLSAAVSSVRVALIGMRRPTP